ncbi:hypothetical protein H7E99_05365 [Proteus mirabilis]|uniref:hypothetical protein n=2 Tax=Proteus mirabilis TaxID=584 RepID=UPI0016261E20|nr:hypothetical protein [Proteus mirabilis]MBB6661301.1 hypothetical protein [Proteus mirabilis]MBB6704423.1 hypothetical protein [Proteus mirabilis]MBB6726528.1 hypothetical protein [Proteus mirabilis]MBG2842832.1 hypothetical protein [Proteus mirabilis]MBN4014094.1 hypothetical protein [Proteus mirabilis]
MLECESNILYFLLNIEKITPEELALSFDIDTNKASSILLSMTKNNLAIIRLGDDDKVIYFIKNKSLEKFLIDDGKLYIENNEPSNSSNSFLYTFIFILIAAPLFYLFLTFISGDKKKEIDYCNSEERAYLASTNMVRNTLKSPSSAKFPHYTEVEIYPAGQCSFQIKSYVDAKNGFGAMIRKPYLTVVTYDEKTQSYLQKSLNFE